MSGFAIYDSVVGTIGNIRTDIYAFNQLTTGSAAVDIVGIYDQKFNQLFQNVRPMKAKIDRKADFPKHPLETGAVIGDHRIIQPIEIELPMIFSYDTFYDDYQTIAAQYYSNNSLIIQTKIGTFPNMFIEEMPTEETPDTINTLTMIFKFIQINVVQSQSVAIPKSATDAATTNKGAQQGTTSTPAATAGGSGSVTYGWFGKLLGHALGLPGY